MSVISMKQLLEAGVHFGHQTRRWNPKMAPYIYTERNGIYIIDLQKTVGMVDTAYKEMRNVLCKRKMAWWYAYKLQDHPEQNQTSERDRGYAGRRYF